MPCVPSYQIWTELNRSYLAFNKPIDFNFILLVSISNILNRHIFFVFLMCMSIYNIFYELQIISFIS